MENKIEVIYNFDIDCNYRFIHIFLLHELIKY